MKERPELVGCLIAALIGAVVVFVIRALLLAAQ